MSGRFHGVYQANGGVSKTGFDGMIYRFPVREFTMVNYCIMREKAMPRLSRCPLVVTETETLCQILRWRKSNILNGITKQAIGRVYQRTLPLIGSQLEPAT
jgi:hypothetical protein